MKMLSVSARFNGERIVLDEPLELETDTRLLVTVLPTPDAEREMWLKLSSTRLGEAYADDEEAYSLDALQETNSEYVDLNDERVVLS